MKTYLSITIFLALLVPSGPRQRIEPDLTAVAAGQGWQVVNRSASTILESGRNGVSFDRRPGAGFAWVEGLELGDGVIEFDVKGQNVPQQSFVGVAFRGVDETTYDAVYLRPFNFKSSDSVSRSHSVQYVSHPDFTWQKLRRERPGLYENAVEPVPDPDDWFHVRVVIERRHVSVFVNDGAAPSLKVGELSERGQGRVGLFMGNNSGGMFANLKLSPAR